MKANELRIGNRVNVPEHNLLNGTVDGITPGGIVLFRELITYSILDKLEPIPLTPEILEQCGFKDNAPMQEQGVFFLNGIAVSNKNYINRKFHLFRPSGDSGVVIEYLHQLQNLYFTFTGDELEINL